MSERMTIEKVEELLSSSEIGDIVEYEKEIKNLKIEDFSFEDKEQYLLFQKTVEKDKSFEAILKNLESFLDGEGSLDYSDHKMKKLKEETEKVSLFERYIILIYFGTEFGVKFPKELRNKYNPEWYIRPTKEGKGIRFPDRINYWDQDVKSRKDYINNLVRGFGLGEKFTYWDGETALKHPSENYWMCLSLRLPGVVANYLREKGVIDTNNETLVKELREKLKVDKELVSAKKASGFSNKELNEVLGVKDIFKEYDKIKDKIELLQKGSKLGEKYLVKNNKIVFLENYSGASDDRGWDVRISKSIIRILEPGFIYGKALNPYFEFGDFPGGQTYKNEGNRVKEIRDVLEKEGSYVVSFLNGNGEEESITIEKENTISGKKAEEAIEEVIREFEDEWLVGINMSAMQVKKYGGDTKMGNYPRSIEYGIKDDRAFMVAVQVIDAERYDELLIDGREQGVIIDPQLKTEVYEVDLYAKEHKFVGSNTTNRNETIGIFLSANEYSGKVELNTKPEILFSGEEVNVTLKARGGTGKWINLTLF